MLKTVVLPNILWKLIPFCSGFLVQTNFIYLKYESVLTLYVFISFDQFKAFLLNKIYLFKRTHTDPKLPNVSVTVTMLAGFESLCFR